MQSVTAFTAGMRGLVYINGRFAGECGPEEALVLPVNPKAAMYGEFRPLDGRFAPCACRVDFDGEGAEIVAGAESIFMVMWPGGVAEIEFMPRGIYARESDFGMVDGIPVGIIRGEGCMLRVGGQFLSVPKGAEIPDEHVRRECEVFFGSCGEGRYMAMFSRGDFAPLGMIEAGRFEKRDDGGVEGVTDLKDIAGHMRTEVWKISERGAELGNVEYAWAEGGPRWPTDGNGAAMAACQAEILGLSGEAEGYLIAGQRGQGILRKICEGAHGCVEMKYAPPKARRAVGILRRENERVARVEAAYFEARPDGGVQGDWVVEFIE